MTLDNLLKNLGAIITISALTISGCGRSENQKTKQYLVYRKDIPHCIQSAYQDKRNAEIFSPAKDQSPMTIYEFYAVVNEEQLRSMGLNPENQCEFDRESWEKYVGVKR